MTALTKLWLMFIGLVLMVSCGKTPASTSRVDGAGGAAGFGHQSSGGGHGPGSSSATSGSGPEVDPDCAQFGDTYDSKPGHGYGSLPASLRGHNGEKQCACNWDAGVGVGLMCQTGYNAAGDHDAPYCVTWLSCKKA